MALDLRIADDMRACSFVLRDVLRKGSARSGGVNEIELACADAQRLLLLHAKFLEDRHQKKMRRKRQRANMSQRDPDTDVHRQKV